VALDHLRLRLPVRVEAVQRVEDEIGVVAGRSVKGDDRIEDGEIRGRHKGQGACLGGAREARQRKRRRDGGGGSGGKACLQQLAAAHDPPLR